MFTDPRIVWWFHFLFASMTASMYMGSFHGNTGKWPKAHRRLNGTFYPILRISFILQVGCFQTCFWWAGCYPARKMCVLAQMLFMEWLIFDKLFTILYMWASQHPTHITCSILIEEDILCTCTLSFVEWKNCHWQFTTISLSPVNSIY